MSLGLRGRLLLAFVLVSVPPILVLGFGSASLLSRGAERGARERLDSALRSARQEIARRQEQAQLAADRVTRDALPAHEDTRPLELASEIARVQGLEVLEILDAEGRVLSSHHWRAGFGLPDRDRRFPGQEAIRIETVAAGHGSAERLAVSGTSSGRWRGQPVQVRAGWFIDTEFTTELSGLMGLPLGLWDELRRRWVVPRGSPLAAWPHPSLTGEGRGEKVLRDETYRWAAAQLVPGLWTVAAMPQATAEAAAVGIQRLALGLAAAVLVLALLAAVVLSARIARPVRELAAGAQRVAAGDLDGAVSVATADEIGGLARSFNAMTADLRDSRERLLQAERVAAWREMARRLAHELKNPLFPIQLSIETLRRALDQEASAPDARAARFASLFRESSVTILEELQSLRKIIDEFSQFARMPRPALLPTDVNAVVEQAVALYRPRAEGVSIETDLAPGLPPAAADRDLLARALGNLIANALEAMPQGGTLRVRTAAEPPGVSVQVEDTGPGLTEEQRTRLFTPYYTTKRGGTGLGLAIVQGIVSDHGGRVQVKSEPGQGTAFTLVLPAVS